ncbi:hypothetical protein ACIQOV_19775 [Kitasatospora sp. NPDC091257]|uniref:hypothetical protein n=1 Tax=Kitasatospora sp. NPDC091257 TaxID=3364084 RepID=UPI0037FC24EF
MLTAAVLGDHGWRKLTGVTAASGEQGAWVSWEACAKAALPSSLLRGGGRGRGGGVIARARDREPSRVEVERLHRQRAQELARRIGEVLTTPSPWSDAAARLALNALLAACGSHPDDSGLRRGRSGPLWCCLFPAAGGAGRIEAVSWSARVEGWLPVFHLAGRSVCAPPGARGGVLGDVPAAVVVVR